MSDLDRQAIGLVGSSWVAAAVLLLTIVDGGDSVGWSFGLLGLALLIVWGLTSPIALRLAKVVRALDRWCALCCSRWPVDNQGNPQPLCGSRGGCEGEVGRHMTTEDPWSADNPPVRNCQTCGAVLGEAHYLHEGTGLPFCGADCAAGAGLVVQSGDDGTD